MSLALNISTNLHPCFSGSTTTAASSSYVCRLRDNNKWEVQEVVSNYRATEIGDIISDEIVTFPSSTGVNKPDHPVRVICVRCNPHSTRGKYKGGSSGVDSDGVLRIATNLSDVPADIIALIFSHR